MLLELGAYYSHRETGRIYCLVAVIGDRVVISGHGAESARLEWFSDKCEYLYPRLPIENRDGVFAPPLNLEHPFDGKTVWDVDWTYAVEYAQRIARTHTDAGFPAP